MQQQQRIWTAAETPNCTLFYIPPVSLNNQLHVIAKGEIDWKFTDGGDCLPFALFLLGHQFQHLYTLACNWAEIGANMSERCRNLMIIKVITRLACLIRRVLLPALILWWIIRPGHCLGTDPQTCVYILRKNPLCPKDNFKLPPNSPFGWEAFFNATV